MKTWTRNQRAILNEALQAFPHNISKVVDEVQDSTPYKKTEIIRQMVDAGLLFRHNGGLVTAKANPQAA